MTKALMHTLAVACLAPAAAPALATASSSATFGNLVVTLTDLDAGDGIAPSLSFGFNGASFVASETQGSGDVFDSQVFYNYAPRQDGMLTGATQTAWSSSLATVATADSLAGFTAMSAQGVAHSGLDGWGTYRSLATGAVPQNAFTLSANTQVTFSVLADMHVTTTMGYNLAADMGEFASSQVLLNLFGNVDGADQFDVQERYLDAYFEVLDDNTTTGVSDSWSGELSVSFTNASTKDASGIFQAFVQTEGYSAIWDGVTPVPQPGTGVTPVPEPGTYAMLLGGLALLGAIARRRRNA